MNRAKNITLLASRAMIVLITAAAVFAQTPAGSQGKAAPKPAAPKPAQAKPAATDTAATPAPPAGNSAVASKGFSRIAVTPQIKEQFEGDQRYAVIVAPNYAGSELNALRYTVADTLELKSELERQGYTVRLISPGEATAESIRSALTNASQLFEGKSQSTFLFAFSGHGFQLKDTEGKDRNYLVTLGVTKERLAQDALPLDAVEKLMTDSGARRKIILIDACRNDPNAKSADGPRTFAQFQESEGTSILLSTRPGGFSYEDRDLGHGIFTYYILEGLRGKAAGKDGYVTFYDLEKYVESNVVARATKMDLVQRPFVVGERSGDFLIATTAPPKPGEIAALPAAVQQVDSNSSMLWQMAEAGQTSQSFYGKVDGPKVTLINSKTLAPFVELTDTNLNDVDQGYHHFKGTSNNQTFDIALQMKGDAVVGARGRIGTPCPGDTACSTTSQLQVLLLPGEKLKAEPLRNSADSVKRGTDAVSAGLGTLFGGKATKGTTKTAAMSDVAVKGADSQNQLLRYRWTSFNLTSNLPKPAGR